MKKTSIPSSCTASDRAASTEGAVNVLDLGVRNDGTEDISAIVNYHTADHALFFPAGVYRVAAPIFAKNPLFGEGYARTPLVMTGTSSGQTFCGDKKVATNSKPVEVRIAADSPLYGATGTVDFELATWARKHTDGLQLVSLNPLRGAEHDSKRRLYVTDDDLSLRVQFHTGRTLIMVR